MKIKLATLAMSLVAILAASALPTNAGPKKLIRDVAREIRKTGVDFILWRHPLWNLAVIAKVGATIADARTTGSLFERCPACREKNRGLFGDHPSTGRILVTVLPMDAVAIVGTHYMVTHRPNLPIPRAILEGLRYGPLLVPAAFQAKAAESNASLRWGAKGHE